MFNYLSFKKILTIFCVASLAIINTSCKRQQLPQISKYFQDALDTTVTITKFKDYKFRLNDIVSVFVVAGSVHQEDAGTFNIPTSTTSRSSIAASYKIDSLGFINMPKIGLIKASGLNENELAKLIETKLVDEVKKPLVIVHLEQFKVNVLGEVKKPGPVYIKTSNANILDAIAEVGDLDTYANKKDVLLMRLNGDKYDTYKIDMTKTAFINTPAFQIFPDDVIYVAPSPIKNRFSSDRSIFFTNLSMAIGAMSTLIFILTTLGILKRN